MSDKHSKLSEALLNIKKILQCNVCHKLPTDAVAAKCGHLFCQCCADKIVNTKRGVCGVCKSILIRSGLNKIESCKKVVADFKALYEASEKDVNATKQTSRQYPAKRTNLSLREASCSRTDTTKSGTSTIQSLKRKGGRPKKTAAKEASVVSVETIKFNAKNEKKTDDLRSTINTSPVFTKDELSNEIEAIGSTEKVKGWLLSESFEEKSPHPEDFTEIPARPTSRSSSVSSDLESFSQIVSKSGVNPKSRAESAQREMKEKNKEVFDKIQKEQNTDKEKPKTSSALTESSWSELKQFKKETRANVRKRKRLNVSIERPSSTKPVVESFDKDDIADEDDKNPKHNGSDEATDSAKKRMKPNVVSDKTLDKSERFDIDVEKLNKRQVKRIIGVVDSDLSKNSTGSLEKSVDKSNTSLRKSINDSKNKSNEGEQSRPQSRQSIRQNESRPESRMSNRSLGKRASDKFRLSTRISSSTPNTSPAKESVEEKIQPAKTKSPLKTSNDGTKKNLSLRRLSSGSSKTTDRENKGISIKKLGKLYKPRKAIKFYYRGSTVERLERTGPLIRDAQTQTSPDDLNEEPETRKIVPQTSTTSPVAGTSSKIPLEGLDTANKVNILSPRDDSQLKYLATESPTVPRISILNSSRRIGDTSKTTGDNSFVSSGADDFSKKVKRFADKLIVTDSEDQDTPMDDSSVIGRRNFKETEKVESPLVASRKNEDVTNVENSSPKRRKKLSGSDTKRRSAEKPKSVTKSIGNREKPEAAGTEVIPKAKSRDDSCQLEDSEPILSNAKHKVVRKLDYSQESGSNCTSQPGKSGSNDKETKRRSPGKKSFRKARLISSSDSDDDLLNISLTTKESSSNSQPVARPGVSQVFGSMVLTEDISVAFSSNRETVDTKRKRSPSPHSLDNNDIKAIAAGWCEEMDRSQKENADDNEAVFRRSQDVFTNSPAPHKKVKIDTKASSLSFDSDQFPILSQTAIYGSRNKPKETDNNRSKSSLSFAGKITPVKNREVESTMTNSSVKRGNTFNGRVNTSRYTTPIKSRSFEARDVRVLSHNSDKENELVEVSKTTTRVDSINSKENVAVSNTKESPSNTELFESLNLNITQEQLLMQELEDNLLGRKSNNATQKKSQDNVPVISKERTPSRRDAHNEVKLRPKGYQVAQIESDDSIIVSDEEIIESTPEKNLLSKKDLSMHVDNSQKSNASLKSFMSVDITPIPNRVPKLLEINSETSPLAERNSRLSTNQEKLPARIASHSTPKTVNLKTGTSGVENKKRFCFVCSCLTPAQVHNVKAFAVMHNVEYTATYKPEVTHVIVETTESDTAGRTLKYLLGVAHKKWIVSYRWVTDCMSEGKLLPEEKYEAVDSDTEPGPRRSRLSKKGLFDDFAFVCMEPFAEITVEQLMDLITSCGGIVVRSLDEFANLKGRHKVILYNGDAHKLDVIVNWSSRRLALPVQVEWILACISQYDLMSFSDYLDIQDPKLAVEMGYPEELIVGEEDSANEASTLVED